VGKDDAFLLVGGFEHEFYFSIQLGRIIIPTDALIFFRGVGIPPTCLELHPLSSSYTLEHFYNPLQLDQLAISLG